MFRAQQNAFDDVVVKATDENLTSENWELIMSVVDKVSESSTGSKDAVAAMIKRLAHRNANVQLYTLELANALSQNCGLPMHKELASRSFTEALLRLAGDRNTHQQVKAKILERMGEWTGMFGRDADLGIMEQAYMRLKTQNPSLQPPSKPHKQQLSDADKRKEEDELQMALALSMKDSGSSSRPVASPPAQAASSSNNTTHPQSQAPAPQPAPTPQGTTAATVSRVRALFDFTPSEPGELAFRKGDIIAVLESVYKDWWKGSLKGATGIFPLNYVEKLQDPTREELEREAQMESEVFNQIGNVEKLLALLSTNSGAGGGGGGGGGGAGGDVRENEEVTELYHSTLAIRPKLIELIGKYSQKKDDMTQLNERFIKARRDYEALHEASMSHPPQPQYGGRPHTQYGGYGGAPLQQSQSYGAPPPQQGGYGAQYQQAINPDPRYQSPPPQQQGPGGVPQNGPQPFYFVPPDQQAQGGNGQQPPRAQSTTHPTVSTDDLYTHPGAPARTNTAGVSDPRRQTIAFGTGQHQVGIPQELATGSFDSPVSSHHDQGYAQPSTQQNQPEYAPYAVQAQSQSQISITKPSAPSDPYGADGATGVGGGGYTQGSGRPPIPGGLASLPSQQAAAAQQQQATSPVYNNSPYGGGVYQAYNPSVSAFNVSSTPGGGGPGSGYPPVRTAPAGGGDESYYR